MTDQRLPGPQVGAAWRSGDPTLATSGGSCVYGDAVGRAGRHARRRRAQGAAAWCSCGSTPPASFSRPRTPAALAAYGRLRSVTARADGDLLVTTDNGGDDAVPAGEACRVARW